MKVELLREAYMSETETENKKDIVVFVPENKKHFKQLKIIMTALMDRKINQVIKEKGKINQLHLIIKID